MCSREDDPSQHDISGGASSYNRSNDDKVRGYDRIVDDICGGCPHPAHWRECQAGVVGLLGSTYRCACRRRGPSGAEPDDDICLHDGIEDASDCEHAIEAREELRDLVEWQHGLLER